MKNSKNKLILIGALLLLAGSAYYFSQSPESNLIEESNLVKKPITTINNTLLDVKTKNDISASSEELSKFNDFDLTEKKSLIILSTFLNDAINGNLPMNSLVEDLKELKLKPIVMKDENEYTGTLNIVRTKDTLPGTRYFHAQYYEGQDTPSFLQHLSFEFKGGNKSFEMVKIVIQNLIGNKSLPTQESEKYISWKIGDKNIWIKKLDLEDISKDDTYNSYNLKNDVGTIRVTTELEIH